MVNKVVSYKDFISQIKCFLKENNFNTFYTTGSHFSELNSLEEIENIDLKEIRTIEPIKIFDFLPKYSLLETKNFIKQKRLIIGVKPCDLNAINVLNKILLLDYEDKIYKSLRENTIIISSDCLYPKETCFCKIVGGNPYTEPDTCVSDINIAFIEEYLILESFSKKGEEILEKYFQNFKEPTQNEFEIRNKIRNFTVKKILDFNNGFLTEDKKEKYYKTLKNTYELNNIWEKESEKCVQCGGCNFICPSCYCFLIREASKSHNDQYRDKVWDVCHFTGYSRVAGGANPRKYKYQRFRNRYQCKFVYRYENFGFYACTGCGRCIEVCPAKIDIRKVTRALVLAKGEQVLV